MTFEHHHNKVHTDRGLIYCSLSLLCWLTTRVLHKSVLNYQKNTQVQVQHKRKIYNQYTGTPKVVDTQSSSFCGKRHKNNYSPHSAAFTLFLENNYPRKKLLKQPGSTKPLTHNNSRIHKKASFFQLFCILLDETCKQFQWLYFIITVTVLFLPA